jgi:hypothetical protein
VVREDARIFRPFGAGNLFRARREFVRPGRELIRSGRELRLMAQMSRAVYSIQMPETDSPQGPLMRSHWYQILQRNASVIRNVEFGLALACVLAAWTAGGDMVLVTPALILGLIFAAIGVVMVPGRSNLSKLGWIGLVALAYVGIGGFLYWHFEPKGEPRIDKPVVNQTSAKPGAPAPPLDSATEQQPQDADAVFVEQPSLLSLFMNALKPAAGMKVFGFSDIVNQAFSGRVYYNIHADFVSNSKFISFYLPHSDNTLNVIYYLMDKNIDVIESVDGALNFTFKNILNSSGVNLRDFIFSRTVHIFYEDEVLDLRKIADLTEMYKLHNELVQFHSSEYKLLVWDQIKLGHVSKIKAYEIRDGLVQPVRRN